AAPAAAPVPDDILRAFGVLRRERTADDALPTEAATALRARGLVPFDPAAARLLRKEADGGRAWIVAVRDVPDLPFAACAVDVPRVVPPVAPPRPVRPGRGARPGRRAAPPAVRVPAPVPVPAPAPAPAPASEP